MNELIFMMWLADLSSGSKGMAAFALASFAIYGGWFWICCLEESTNGVKMKKPSKVPLYIGVTLAVSAWLMPSKQTIYAAVALKAGAEIVESRVGQKAVVAIEAILDEVIAKKDKK